MDPTRNTTCPPARWKPKDRRTRTFLVAGVLAFLGMAGLIPILVGVGVGPVLLPSEPRSPGEEAGVLRRENRILAEELELATAGRPYLFLDLAQGVLALRSQGIPLREYPVRAWEVRIGRLPLRGSRPLSLLEAAWKEGTLLPIRREARTVILADTVTPPDPSGSVAFIPPSPEEAFPTLPSFRIRFRGNAGLLVQPSSPADRSPLEDRTQDPGAFHGLVHWIRMRPWRQDRLRVLIVLSPEDAGAFYRAYSDGTPLLLSGLLGR